MNYTLLKEMVKSNKQWEPHLRSNNLPFCRPNIVGKRKDHFKLIQWKATSCVQGKASSYLHGYKNPNILVNEQ